MNVRKLENKKYIIYGYKYIITFYEKNCQTYIEINKKEDKGFVEEVEGFVEENDMEGEEMEIKEGLFVCLDLFFKCVNITYNGIGHIYVKFEEDKEYSEEYEDNLLIEILGEEIRFIKEDCMYEK